MNNGDEKAFDGQSFASIIVLAILIFLLIFGSTDLGDITNAPD